LRYIQAHCSFFFIFSFGSKLPYLTLIEMSGYLPAATPWTIPLFVVLVCLTLFTFKLKLQNAKLEENLLESKEKVRAKEKERDVLEEHIQEFSKLLADIMEQRDTFKNILTTGIIIFIFL